MVKAKRPRRYVQPDGMYILKLLLYVLVGSLWLKVSVGSSATFGIPVGFIIGVAFTVRERFRIDRKIEYAALIVAMLVGYFASYGVHIRF